MLGFEKLMDGNRIEYLTLTYQLFMRIRKGLDDLCVAFSNYIKVRVPQDVIYTCRSMLKAIMSFIMCCMSYVNSIGRY